MGKKDRGTGSNTVPYIKGWVRMVGVRGLAGTIEHLIIPQGLGVLYCVTVRMDGWLSGVGGRGFDDSISLNPRLCSVLCPSNQFKIQFTIQQ